MRQVGFIGWRGMVGSVLMQRMAGRKRFCAGGADLFTTSQKGGKVPDIGQETPPLKDAHDIDELKAMDILVSCQGGRLCQRDISQVAAKRAGTVTGSTPPRHCVWEDDVIITRPRSICRLSSRRCTMV